MKKNRKEEEKRERKKEKKKKKIQKKTKNAYLMEANENCKSENDRKSALQLWRHINI